MQQANTTFNSYGAPKQPQAGGGFFDKAKQMGNTLNTAYKFNKSLGDVRQGGQGMMSSTGGMLGAVPQMGSHFGNALGAAQQFSTAPTSIPNAMNAGYRFGNAALGALNTGIGAMRNVGNFVGSAAQAGQALPGLISNGLNLAQQTGRMPQLPFFKTSAFDLGVASVQR